MFYDKNINIHQALSNKFNNKKTISDDISRVNSLYKTKKIINTKINLNFDKKDETKILPIITQKNIIIPVQNKNDIYNLSNINKNINSIIGINNDSTIDNDKNVDILYKKMVYKINNVYQESYKENKKPTGFGDFIRGCYFFLEFCEKYKFIPNIIINHPIALFLKSFDKHYYDNKKLNEELFSNISNFSDNNLNDSKIDENGYIINEIQKRKGLHEFIDYLCNLDVNQNNIFMYNILFPYNEIKEEHKQYMRKILEPTEYMSCYINETIQKLEIELGQYNVIHIRSGDIYLDEKSKNFDSTYLKKICDHVFTIINENSSINYLLIADNNEIKYLLCKIFPTIKVVYNSITHLGEGKVLKIEKVKNTLLDFYLFANSCFIHSISSYTHGSGFSLWCAKTYNIPYRCKYIKLLN